MERLKRHQQALDSYDMALKYGSRDAVVWYARGGVLRSLKQFDKALASYDSALARNASPAAVWSEKSVTLFLMGRYEESLSSCDKALIYAPGRSDLIQQRQQILGKLGRK
ncbi:MAG: tetratricopeptide repeat protein [Candidatus Zixiibacteriota bacterium]|nr:MAG: tetratricopeptide repeat protein [candidate division Zixibacteria bacterium]